MKKALSRARGVALGCSIGVLAGCMGDPGEVDLEVAGGALVTVAELDTFVPNCIQIDDLAGSGDANLVTGNDGDGSASANLPACSAGPYVDWANLAASLGDHRVFDLPGANGRDSTAFPRSDGCVSAANVLSKMDLTYGVVANNFEYVYLGLQRAAVNGDAAYYWLFTRIDPSTVSLASGDPGFACQTGEDQLRYDISGPGANGATGDVLVRGSFQGGGGVLLEVFQANAIANSEGPVGATSAVDYTNPRWTLNAGGVAAVAVNTTPTTASLGTDGVKTLSGGRLPATGSFAEAAVDLGIFTGQAPCGASYFASVVTRSSGAGGTSPDLKDLLGPFEVNFGSLSASASMTGLCDLSADFDVFDVRAPDGTAIANPGCAWTFDDAGLSASCEGNHAFASAGAHTADVTVTDPASGCSVVVENVDATVRAPVLVDLTRAAAAQTCAAGMTSDAAAYSAVVTGGGGSYTYTWNGVACSGSTCTIDPADATFCAGPTTFSVTVSDGVCPPATSETESYQKVTVVTATDLP